MYKKEFDMFLTDNNIVYLPDIKAENVDYEKLVEDLGLESENTYVSYPLHGDKKRMRLSQLTWEEKLQRKKLRNRIAAQTSRDRKKAKMDHLEEAVKDLKQQNELLLSEVEELKKKNELLVDANAELQKALALRPYTCSCLQRVKEDFGVIQSPHKMEEQICVRDGYSFERPAESSEIPQQKGPQPAVAQVLTEKSLWRIWKIFLLSLLCQGFWQTSRQTPSSMTLKNWQKISSMKLNIKRIDEILSLHSERFQKLVEKNSFVLMKWWGRHQKNWNPLEMQQFLDQSRSITLCPQSPQ